MVGNLLSVSFSPNNIGSMQIGISEMCSRAPFTKPLETTENQHCRIDAIECSRDSRCDPSASTCALSRRMKARELQTDYSSRHSRVFRWAEMTLLIALSVGLWDSVYQH